MERCFVLLYQTMDTRHRDPPSPGIEIRRAGPEDADRLTGIARRAKAHWGYPAAWLAAWRESLTLTPGFILAHDVYLAATPAETIGFYALLDGGDHWMLDHLWIDPAFHGRGAGRRLFDHAMDRVRSVRPGPLRIEGDPHASGFYRRMGATLIGSVPAPAEGAPGRTLPLFEIRADSR